MSTSKTKNSVRYREEYLDVSPRSDARKCYNRYKHKLSDEEKQWYEDFQAAYYGGNKKALERICKDSEHQKDILAERNYNSNASARAKPNGKTRKSGYSPADYIPSERSVEDDLISVLDIEKSRSKNKK